MIGSDRIRRKKIYKDIDCLGCACGICASMCEFYFLRLRWHSKILNTHFGANFKKLHVSVGRAGEGNCTLNKLCPENSRIAWNREWVVEKRRGGSRASCKNDEQSSDADALAEIYSARATTHIQTIILCTSTPDFLS